MFHNDIFIPDGIRGVVTPVKDQWYWHGRIGLYLLARRKSVNGDYLAHRRTISDSGHL